MDWKSNILIIIFSNCLGLLLPFLFLLFFLSVGQGEASVQYSLSII